MSKANSVHSTPPTESAISAQIPSEPLALFNWFLALREDLLRSCRERDAALLAAIVAEDDDGYDCIELEAMHLAQQRARRRGTAKHRGQR